MRVIPAFLFAAMKTKRLEIFLFRAACTIRQPVRQSWIDNYSFSEFRFAKLNVLFAHANGFRRIRIAHESRVELITQFNRSRIPGRIISANYFDSAQWNVLRVRTVFILKRALYRNVLRLHGGVRAGVFLMCGDR